jgi:hypothetical protein
MYRFKWYLALVNFEVYYFMLRRLRLDLNIVVNAINTSMSTPSKELSNESVFCSDVLAWLGLEATGFGLALGGCGFWDSQAKP